jgi:hypothetical protein
MILSLCFTQHKDHRDSYLATMILRKQKNAYSRMVREPDVQYGHKTWFAAHGRPYQLVFRMQVKAGTWFNQNTSEKGEHRTIVTQYGSPLHPHQTPVLQIYHFFCEESPFVIAGEKRCLFGLLSFFGM